MIFKIYKTTDREFNKDQRPCEKAMPGQEDYTRIEWIADETGNPIRQIIPCKKDIWIVDIETLEDLLALQKEINEEIILCENVIEIYDGYRE